MPAAADDDEVVSRLGLRLAPGLRPAFVAGEALADEGEGGIAPAHDAPSRELKIGHVRMGVRA